MASPEENWHLERWRQDVAFQLASELDRSRWGGGADGIGTGSRGERDQVRDEAGGDEDAASCEPLLGDAEVASPTKSTREPRRRGGGGARDGSDSDSDSDTDDSPHGGRNLPSRVVRAALSSASSFSFFSDSVSFALLFVSLSLVLAQLHLSGVLLLASQVGPAPWLIVSIPLWIAAVLCIAGSSRILVHAYCRRRFFGGSELRPQHQRQKLSRTTVIDHVNHIVFWIATSASVILLGTTLQSQASLSPAVATTAGFPALTMASPLFLAMCVQSTLYCAKNRSRTCGFFLPDGFPVDPVHVTALFVAARVDELIMWDWNIVLWCPYLFWALAVYNCFVYGIVAFDVVRTHAAQCERPIQEQHYAMLVAPNTYVRPYWLAVRSVLRFAVALTSSVCIFVSVHYGALRLNGAAELVSTAAMTLPLAVALAVAGILTLVMSWVVAPRLVAAEPHRCSYCAEPIRLLLQIDLRARSGHGRGHVLDREGKDKTSLPASRTVRVLRYENPSDNLTIDLGEQDSTVDGTLLSSTIRRPKDGSVPLRLARAVGKAMWEEFRGHFDADKGGAEGRFGGEEAELDSGRGDSPSSPYDPQQCTVCRSRPADCVFLDCGHAVQCWDCSRHVIRSRNRQRRAQP